MAEVKPAPVETEIPAAPVATTSEATPAPVEPVVETKPETTEIAPVEAKTETTEAPAADATEAAPEATPEAPKELEPISEGILETKVSFIPIYFKKYTYYLQEEAVPEEQLAEIKREKAKTKAAQANYAHATQTGKGLLFFSKGDKTKPVGIIKLDGAEITTQGEKKFTIKTVDQETHLEAGTSALRERWVASLKTASADAAGISATLAETDGYKTVLDKFKSPIAAAVAAKKEEIIVDDKKDDEDKKEEEKEEEKKEEKEEKKEKKDKKKKEKKDKDDDSSSSSSDEEKEEKKEKKKEEKKEKRSASKTRNRFSFFGKKEKDEKKEEEPAAVTAAPVVEDKEETPATIEPTPVAVATTEPALAPAPVPATTETPAETAKEVPEEPKTETSPVSSPKATNRKSFLGKFPSFLKGDAKEKKAETPAATTEETPKSPDPVPEVAATTEVQPLGTKEVEPVAEPTAKPVEEPKTETPAEGSKSPIAGLVDNIKEALALKKEEKKEDKTETETKDVPAIEATTDAPKEKEGDAPVESPRDRKSSLFGSFGRREKSTDGTNDEKPKRSLSFWKKEKKPVSEKDAPAAITESEPTPAVTEPVKNEIDNEKTTQAAVLPAPIPDNTTTTTESEVVGGRIGDVVPAAVTVGDSRA